MKVIDFAIITIGIGLLLIAWSMRGTKRNWVGVFAGGCTLLVLDILSKIFGFSL
jgi:hypothetical protein